MPAVSIVVPVLNEAAAIAAALQPLQAARVAGHEVVVVDGGSHDGTPALAAPLCDRVIVAPRGRASQMNAGAAASRGAMLLFLHADTVLPANALALVEAALRERAWGRFDVAIAGNRRLALVAAAMNLRSRLSGIATGDQAIFVRREAFESLGGFPSIPLMEDVAFSRAARRRLGRPACLRARAITSGRRWERHGVLRTVLLMWRLRLEYALGADPHRLARRYGVERTSS